MGKADLVKAFGIAFFYALAIWVVYSLIQYVSTGATNFPTGLFTVMAGTLIAWLLAYWILAGLLTVFLFEGNFIPATISAAVVIGLLGPLMAGNIVLAIASALLGALVAGGTTLFVAKYWKM